MPERRRPADSAEERVSAALLAAAADVRRESDPAERVRRVGSLIAAVDDGLGAAARLRLEAVSELRRQGWSLDRIARETGLSKARVAQLAKSGAEMATPKG